VLFFHSVLVDRLWGLIMGRFAERDSHRMNISIIIDEKDSIDPHEDRVFHDENASG